MRGLPYVPERDDPADLRELLEESDAMRNDLAVALAEVRRLREAIGLVLTEASTPPRATPRVRQMLVEILEPIDL